MKNYIVINKAIEDVVTLELQVEAENIAEVEKIILQKNPLFIHGANIKQIDDVESPDFAMYSLETTKEQRQQYINQFGKVPELLQRFADNFSL